MTDNSGALSFKTFIKDFFTIALSFPLFVFFLTAITIMAIGRREDGMGLGLIFGFAAGLGLFYCLCGRFTAIWTIAQVIVNAGLTTGEFYIVAKILEGTSIAEASYGLILILLSVPFLVSINRQVLDFFILTLNGQQRRKEQEKKMPQQ
jgi:hypothetical protein